MTLEQLLRPLEVALGEIEARAGCRQAGTSLVERCAVGALVDDEQEITLAHERALDERRGTEITVDARADFHALRRGELAGVFVPVRDLAR